MLLHVDHVEKKYTRGLFNKQTTFCLQADFSYEDAGIIGVMGANGAGKTTLFEMIAGTTPPSSGTVYCQGYDMQSIKYKHRDRLAIHYHQSYQVRNIQWTKPEFTMKPCYFDYPSVHLFDEPQFNTQDGYIPFMLQYFRQLYMMRCLVFVSVHPTEVFQLEIVRNLCQKFMFVHKGQITHYATWEAFTREENVRDYLGDTLLEYE
jgi:ABC-type multidrug transport system ATPase subunit